MTNVGLTLPVGLALAALGAAGCTSDLGSRSGPCLGCDGGVVPTADGGSDAGSDGGSDGGPAPPADAWTAPVDAFTPSDAWAAPDTGPPPPLCSWVWIDRGGPAFQPHACRDGAGVVGGMLVDPRAFFAELVAGRDPDTWQTVMNEIEGELWSCGVGQQRGSGGDVRGRLFLPTATCPDASPPPGDATAIHLGVRQEPDCWSHPADVVSCP